MKTISRNEIVEVHQELLSLDEQETRKLFRRFQKKQEPMLVYTAAISEREELNEDEQDILFTLTLLCWQVLQKHFPRLKRISLERIEDMDNQMIAFIESYETTAEEDLWKKARKALQSTQPNLMDYFVASMMEGGPESGIREEMRSMLFFVLKTILDLFIEAASGIERKYYGD